MAVDSLTTGTLTGSFSNGVYTAAEKLKEIWLKCENDAIQIPILPPSFTISMENSHQVINVHTKGDVTIIGKKGVKNI